MSIEIGNFIIIQSLNDQERQTGYEVQQAIKLAILRANAEDPSFLVNVHSKQELLDVLSDIAARCTDDLKPLLHFDIHGSPSGFYLSNGDDVSWEDIKELIREINIACKNSLYISLATCYGGYLLNIYEYTKPCPFYGYIGPLDEMGGRDLEDGFSAFYAELIDTRNFQAALNALNANIPGGASGFVFINCKQYFNMLVPMLKARTNLNLDERGTLLLEMGLKWQPLKTYDVQEYIRRPFERVRAEHYSEEKLLEHRRVFLHQQTGSYGSPQ
jgi:hypothetical protein